MSSYKRAVGTAVLIGIGNLSGVCASNWYRAQDAPKYLLGHGMEIMVIVFGFTAVNILYLGIGGLMLQETDNKMLLPRFRRRTWLI